MNNNQNKILGGFFIYVIIIAVFFIITSSLSYQVQKEKVIITTTNILGDIIKNIVGEHATVVSLMKPGVNPHTYETTLQDGEKLSKSWLIFYNGLDLEGPMQESLQHLGRTKPVYACSDGLEEGDIRHDPNFEAGKDPHVWMDVNLMKKQVVYMTDMIITNDPDHAAAYRQRSELYLEKLTSLDEEIKSAIASIKKEKRLLVTSHDAFIYFGDAYGIIVEGALPISSVGEFDLKKRFYLQKKIVASGISTIFSESSINNKHVMSIIEGCKVTYNHTIGVSGPLYSDSLGSPGTLEGTYIGMMRYNVRVIVEGLNKVYND